jgi:DNA-binding PadR family transcriptional regulator
MNNFKVIYRILRFLERSMDCEELDAEAFTPEHFRVSEQRWLQLLEMLRSSGYIDGVSVHRGADGDVVMSVSHPRITLKGLEYLQENSLMQKAAGIAKGISDIVL